LKNIYLASDNIVSPLGDTTTENFNNILSGKSAVRKQMNTAVSDSPVFASLFESGKFASDNIYTPFEQLLISSIKDALSKTSVTLNSSSTLLVIASTKGNIALLNKENTNAADEISMATSAAKVAAYFNYHSQPVVISNACISGLVAMLVAKRLINSGAYKHAVVAGADVISRFIYSGFESFQALSSGLCMPFDKNRSGINLGEAAASVVLTSDKNLSPHQISFSGGSVSNDSNHISGPSITGNELHNAISNTLKEADITSEKIDFINAHGTATIYNDEMESKAINLSGMNNVPVNSLKGYFGHTLGAAGIAESVVSIHAMMQDVVLPTNGLQNVGVNINVSTELQHKKINYLLKTASGFGGCNAAVIFNK
jgi:3-oxoacyl-[acyl-carrier-protein] synthase-1